MKKLQVMIAIMFLLILGGVNVSAQEIVSDNTFIVCDSSVEYAIIIPQDCPLLVKRLADNIAAYILHHTGTDIVILADDDPASGLFEILLGETSREDSQTVMASLSENEYRITKTQANNLVIVGTDIYRLTHAVDQFIANCLEVADNNTVTYLQDRMGSLSLSDWEIRGAFITNKMRATYIKAVAGTSEQSNLAGVTNVRLITQLTGEYSLNTTRSLYNVSVGDLGDMCLHNGRLYFFFGDTNGGKRGNQNLRSNVMAYTTDLDYTDGIVFDGYLAASDGQATYITQGSFGANAESNAEYGYEYTKIPTGAISLDGSLYMSYMSVAWWGETDDWLCNYGGIMKSSDDGETWAKLEAEWPGDTKFCQIAPVLNTEDGYVYVVGITGGRHDKARMMRVLQSEYEQFDAYEYLVGYDDQGDAIWASGDDGLYSDFALINEDVWEPSIMYSEYLDEWLICYKDAKAIRLYTAKEACGPYELTVSIPYPHDTAGYYAAKINAALTSNDGEKLGVLMSFMYASSEGANMWQVQLLEITLDKK